MRDSGEVHGNDRMADLQGFFKSGPGQTQVPGAECSGKLDEIIHPFFLGLHFQRFFGG
jgi:hypothetical protein